MKTLGRTIALLLLLVVAGDKLPARIPGKGKLKALEDAPGSYVKLRLDAKKAAA